MVRTIIFCLFWYIKFQTSGDSQQPKDFKQYQESVLNIKEELSKLQSQLKKLVSLNFR